MDFHEIILVVSLLVASSMLCTHTFRRGESSAKVTEAIYQMQYIQDIFNSFLNVAATLLPGSLDQSRCWLQTLGNKFISFLTIFSYDFYFITSFFCVQFFVQLFLISCILIKIIFFFLLLNCVVNQRS